jgi:hypothetical protein
VPSNCRVESLALGVGQCRDLNRGLCLGCGRLRGMIQLICGLVDLGQRHSATLLHWREVRSSLELLCPLALNSSA